MPRQATTVAVTVAVEVAVAVCIAAHARRHLQSKMLCGSCGAHAPLLQRWHEGDWFCNVCGNHNFAPRRINNTYCPTMKLKPGDWVCSRCTNHNHAKNLVCNTRWCRLPKPASG